YNKLSRKIREIAEKLKNINENDPWRAEMTELLTAKLHNLGLIPTKRSLMLASKVNASSFCRRRLSVIVMRSKMAETMKAAVTFVEQGHVRVGPDIIRDPAYLVTRFVTDLNLLSYVKFNSKLLFLRCRKLSQRFFSVFISKFAGRSMEDYITWGSRSKIRKRIEDYNGLRDDYDDV
ncbi:U3 small nucleolar ribonucleoprotein IMP3, partial [Schistosoma bovis]